MSKIQEVFPVQELQKWSKVSPANSVFFRIVIKWFSLNTFGVNTRKCVESWNIHLNLKSDLCSTSQIIWLEKNWKNKFTLWWCECKKIEDDWIYSSVIFMKCPDKGVIDIKCFIHRVWQLYPFLGSKSNNYATKIPEIKQFDLTCFSEQGSWQTHGFTI